MNPIGRIAQLGGILLLAGIGRGLSAEPAATAPEPPPPPVEEVGRTLSGARKDFEAVKSLREHGADLKTDSGRLALPRMPSAPTPAAVAPLRSERVPENKVGSNWLVEAMQNREPGRQARAEDPRRLEGVGEARRGPDEDQAPLEGQPERKVKVPTPNPFAPYLQGWMSPGDMALLRPALEPTRGMSTSGFQSAPGETGFRVRGNSEEFGQLRATQPLAGTNAPNGGSVGVVRENPYLENLEKGPSAGLGPAMPARPPALPAAALRSSPPPPAGLPPTTAPTPQTRIPEFVRPNADDKYFKPLKRF